MKQFSGALFLAALISGCAITNSKNIETDLAKKDKITKEASIVNSNISSELHRILDGKVVEGKGEFDNNSPAIAKNGALIIAINDIADQLGKLLIENGTILTENEIKSIVSTKKSDLISGYTTVTDSYDKTTRIAQIVIRQNGERIATEIAKITIEE